MSITDFLVICSGANRTALALRPDTTERKRAAAVGASVFLTGVSALVSATYAGYVAFHSRPWAAVIGVTWGAMIFTLDRLLVAGVPRPDHRILSPIERVRETRLAFLATIPRLLLAALIALPIAIPLQLRFFERELDMEFARRRAAVIAQARLEAERMYPELRTLEATNAELRQSVTEKEKRVDQLLDAMLHDEAGRETQRIADDRRAAYMQGRRDLERLRLSVEQQIAENNARLGTIRRALDERASILSPTLDASSQTFLARLDALNSLKDRDKMISQASAWLLALFVALQIAPVLMQLLATSRPNAAFWEAVSVMADLSQIPISSEQPVTESASSNRPRVDIGVKPPLRDALRVFMCHCSEDKAFVRALTKQLHQAGVDPWLDEQRLRPGQRWEDEITKAVRNSDAVIICLSRRGVRKRGFAQKEIRFAMDVALEQPEGSIFLIPAKLEECDVPLHLQKYQYVRMYEPNGYPHLLESLTERATELGRTAPEEHLPVQT